MAADAGRTAIRSESVSIDEHTSADGAKMSVLNLDETQHDKSRNKTSFLRCNVPMPSLSSSHG